MMSPHKGTNTAAQLVFCITFIKICINYLQYPPFACRQCPQ